ncbi:MAG: PAS domain-containing sensor histidine kinase [Gammaproteobacteria bacterium]|nr:PAS domain-containing sensor histidine kinase [Gammaproteobacteria bacterium]
MQADYDRKTDLDELKDAFEAFNKVSGDLQSSYDDLQLQVKELQSQLDIANRKRAEEAERNTELARRLTALLEALPGGVIMLDEDGVVREQNSTADHFLGRPLKDMEWTLICRRAFRDETSTHGDLTLHDGRMVSLAQQDMVPGPGRVLLFTDVTERRKVQEILARQKRLTAMGEMAAALAHQIRTPLSAAVLYTSNAALPGVPAGHKDELLGKATHCLQTLEQLIGDMLHFARGASYTESGFDIDELLDSVENALLPLARDGQQVRFVRAARNARLTGNCEAVAGAILNLATNGLSHAGTDARLTIEARIGNYDVEIRVSDNGPGIPPEQHERIFEPFFTSRPDGTGLGLAVARSVAEAHHGSLQLDANATRGATFVLRLPLDNQFDRRTSNDIRRLTAPVAARTQAEEAAV